MSVAPRDKRLPPRADESPARARQWCRAALALAILFATLPLAAKLFLGSWGFDGAPTIACFCLIAAAYFYFAGREERRAIPDSAAILEAAIRLAAAGEGGRAIGLLDHALRLSPGLWQAWQYRGEIRLAEPGAAELAVDDFSEAIRLAPGEAHLFALRSQAFTLLGRESSARADRQAAGLAEEPDAGIAGREAL